MKKVFCAVIAVLLIALTFAGCGKTDATKQTEKLISSIGGKINLDSEEAILAAREAFDALSEEEQAKVKNTEKLEKAENEFNAIVGFNEDIAAVVSAAEASFSEEDFNISELIEKAASIAEEYETMSEERKSMVVDYDKLAAASEVLASYAENARIAAAQYVKAFLDVYADEKYEVTAVYCIKQIRNEIDEYHMFALTYKDASGKEKDVYSHARCTTEVSAEAIAARPETFFAEVPVTDDSDAKENGNVLLDIAAVLPAE